MYSVYCPLLDEKLALPPAPPPILQAVCSFCCFFCGVKAFDLMQSHL